MVILENIDIDIDSDMDILENIDIDKGISKNIDIDKILYRLEFGISNTGLITSNVHFDRLFTKAL